MDVNITITIAEVHIHIHDDAGTKALLAKLHKIGVNIDAATSDLQKATTENKE